MRNKVWLAFFVMAGLTFLAPVWAQVCTPPPSGLISWWPGDGNANDIVGGNNGSLLNGVTFAAGMVDQAFSFDGIDDFVEIPENGSLDLNGDFTVDAWVNPNDLTGPIPRPVVSKYSFAGQNWQNTAWELSAQNDGKVQFGVICGTTTLSAVTTNPVVSVGEFTHLAAVYRQSIPSVEIYVDGVLQAGNTGGSCTAINQNDIPVRIGMRIDAAVTTFFNGLIDEVEIYNRALPASEIHAIFNAGSAGKCKDADGDGVPDTQDDCVNSVVTATVVIGGCDSGVPNTVFPNGCTISDRIQQCAAGAQDNSQFVGCVAHLTNELKKANVISGQRKGAIQRCAARANIP